MGTYEKSLDPDLLWKVQATGASEPRCKRIFFPIFEFNGEAHCYEDHIRSCQSLLESNSALIGCLLHNTEEL